MLTNTIKELLETKMAKCSEVCQTVAKLMMNMKAKCCFPKELI